MVSFSDSAAVLYAMGSRGFDLGQLNASFRVSSSGVFHWSRSVCAPSSGSSVSSEVFSIGEFLSLSDVCSSCAEQVRFGELSFPQWVENFKLALEVAEAFERPCVSVADYFARFPSVGESFPLELAAWFKDSGFAWSLAERGALIREFLLPELHVEALRDVFWGDNRKRFGLPGLERAFAGYQVFVDEQVKALLEVPGWLLVDDGWHGAFAGLSGFGEFRWMFRAAYGVKPEFYGKSVVLVPAFLECFYAQQPKVRLDARPSAGVLEAVEALYAPGREGPYKELEAAYAAAVEL